MVHKVVHLLEFQIGTQARPMPIDLRHWLVMQGENTGTRTRPSCLTDT
ncbi:MAG: hypothetical protein L3J36_01980 [Rhodobacteraceae bacterium]|nr:hypothetical protein [Paracoccaceae bacterium]